MTGVSVHGNLQLFALIDEYLTSMSGPSYKMWYSWYVLYLRDKERFSMGEVPVQDIISLVTKTLTVYVT